MKHANEGACKDNCGQGHDTPKINTRTISSLLLIPFNVLGIYYDGINFDRLSMRRVRKLLDRGAGPGKSPLIDIHTGFDQQCPPSVGYLSHFPYANMAWNGEGLEARTNE